VFYSLRKKLLHLKHKRTNHYSVFRWRDLVLLLDTKDYISRKILIGGGFEPDLVDAIERRLALRKPALFVDVGANLGLYSGIAARAGVAEIHAFEPNPRLLAFQRANIAMNDLRNIEVHAYGLSDIDADDQDFLISPRSNSGLSKFGKRPSNNDDWQLGRISVRRLDGVLTHSGQIVILKVDVEGAEPRFLAGAKTFLTSNRCDLFIEIIDGRAEVSPLLAAMGYRQQSAFKASNFWFANYDVHATP
jgi:FkbM family methyltransferase